MELQSENRSLLVAQAHDEIAAGGGDFQYRRQGTSFHDQRVVTRGGKAGGKSGEQFALVTVAFKVAPSFKASPMKRPTVTDAADKRYNTASTFVDVGSAPEYSCTFPFRVPEGTKLKALQLESTSLDLTSLDK